MLESTKAKLQAAEIQQFVYEDFYDEFVKLIQRMADHNIGVEKKKAILLAEFQSLDGILHPLLPPDAELRISSVSNSIVMYLRLLTVSPNLQIILTLHSTLQSQLKFAFIMRITATLLYIHTRRKKWTSFRSVLISWSRWVKKQESSVFDSFAIFFLNHSLDNVVIEALCKALELDVDVAYLDGSNDHQVDFIKIRHGADASKPLTLLYR